MKETKRFAEIFEVLKREYPDAGIALDFGTEFELLVAVILSAQCTDVRVNKVTPALFNRYPTVTDFANADLKELEKLIFSTGFYRNKAKNIKGAAQRVVAKFGGELPRTMSELLTLPGVARKTANVVMSAAFGVNDGIVVDTHVMRISGKLGLVAPKWVASKNAVKIEEELMKIVPRKDWGLFSDLLIFHGRQVCVARRSKCSECLVSGLCPGAEC
jgi:endonuclease-3